MSQKRVSDLLATELSSGGRLHQDVLRDTKRVELLGFDIVIAADVIHLRAGHAGLPSASMIAKLEEGIAAIVGEPVRIGVWYPSRSGRPFANCRRLSDPRVEKLGEANELAPRPPRPPLVKARRAR